MNFSPDKNYKKKFLFHGQEITIEKNFLAKQSESAFLVTWNKTVILLTLCVGKTPMSVNFVPLTVEFQENLFSVSKIPGGFNRREGRPSDYASLSARIVDRTIRNLFPKDFCYDTQIFVNPLAVDHSLDLRVVAILATSLVLNTSSLPINSLFAGVNVGFIDNTFILNPSYEDMKKSQLELFLTGTEDKINMIEVSASELTEEQVMQAIEFGHESIIELLKFQKELLKDFTVLKKDYPQAKEIDTLKNAEDKIITFFGEKIDDLVFNSDNSERSEKHFALEREIIDYFSPLFLNEDVNKWSPLLLNKFANLVKSRVREKTLKNEKRIDGRTFDEIRPISCSNDFLPVVHGSAIFNRGATQTLSVVTLAGKNYQKIIDNITIDSTSNFLHHYKSLPFSIGTVQRMRGISRREIGHGFLGEKALKRVLPSFEDFPYFIRVNSEIMASNGSTSQAAICSASLAMLSAGIPIKNSVAGIAIGLLKDDDNYVLLSDIQAWEDFYGDMDFKIAGTKKGICSIQLDLKIAGLPLDVIAKILLRGKVDRHKILQVMDEVIAKPRDHLAHNVPKFAKLEVDPKNIGLVIGPNGKNIKEIISKFKNPEIEIDDKGLILIYHKDEKILAKIVQSFKDLLTNGKKNYKIGDIILGKVDRITEYGAFVKLDEKKSGLIHISSLSDGYVRDVKQFLTLNQKVKVKIAEINDKNQIKLKLA